MRVKMPLGIRSHESEVVFWNPVTHESEAPLGNHSRNLHESSTALKGDDNLLHNYGALFVK